MKMVFGWGKKKEKREEIPPAAGRDVSISGICPILDDAAGRESDRLVEQTKKLQFPIACHIESLLRIAIELEKEQLNTDNIDVNIVTIVKRGKKQVLDVIHKESERQLPELNSVDDVKAFNRTASQTLTKIGDVLGKQTRVIHIFAKKHAGKLKEILERFSEDVDHSNRLLSRYDEFEANKNKISDLLTRLDSDNSAIRSSSEKIAGLERSISEQKSELKSLEGKINEFKSSPRYEKYLAIQRQLSELDSKRSQVESRINGQTILISRPVSKYEYGSSLDKETKKLIGKLVSSPFEVFLPENRDEVITILENIKKAISSDHLSVKEPAKTLGYIDDIVSKTDGFIRAVDSVVSEQGRLHGELETLDLDALEGYQKRHAKRQEDVDFSESRIRELKSEINSLESGRPSRLREIESVMNRLGNVKYTISE